MKLEKILYWTVTAVMCFIFLFSAFNYFFNYEMIAGFFENLGFPTWLIYPLAIAKVLAVVAILSRQSRWLLEWAYAGFFFDAVLAFASHQIADDESSAGAAIAIFATLLSRFLHFRQFPDQ